MKNLAVLLLSLLIFSCDLITPKNEQFYCKVNGKAYRPKDSSSPVGGVGAATLTVEWDKKGWFYIRGRQNTEIVSLSIKLDPNSFLQIQEYPLGNSFTNTSGDYYYDYTVNNPERLISIDGKVNISKIEGKYIWGTFEFNTKTSNSGKSFSITKGQFNQLYYTTL